MDYVIIGIVVVAVAVWLVRRSADRRRVEPPEDTWELPSADGSPAAARPPAPWDDPLPVLTREALLPRDRTLDPSKWDNTPDELVGTDPEDPSTPAPDADAPDLPQFFDRSYLEGRTKERPE